MDYGIAIPYFYDCDYILGTEAEAEHERDLKLKTGVDKSSDEEGQFLQDEKLTKNGQSTEKKADKTTIRQYADESSKSRFLFRFIFIKSSGMYYSLINI